MTFRNSALPWRLALVGTALLARIATTDAQILDPAFLDDIDEKLLTELLLGHAVPIWYLTFAAMFAAVLLLAWLGIGNRSGAAGASEEHGPQLPSNLRNVSAFGARYTLDTFSGTVTSHTTTTHKHVTVTNTVNPDGLAPTTSTSTTWTYSRLIGLRYPGGGGRAWELHNSSFAPVVGQPVSFVVRHTKKGAYDTLLAYNHATGVLERFKGTTAHRIGGFVSWLAATIVGVLGLLWSVKALFAAMVESLPNPPPWLATMNPLLAPSLLEFTAIAGVVALVPYLLGRVAVSLLRNLIFRRRYLPDIRRFLEASTPALRQKLGS